MWGDRDVLTLRNVCKSFRSDFLRRQIPVLKGITMTVGRGEIYGFLGVNGAGKTTTIKCILGLLTPDRGSIEMEGRPLDRQSRQRIGFLPENPYFYDYLSAREYLALVGALFSLPSRETACRTGELLAQVGLPEVGSLKLRKFSKGMTQRLGLAAALLGDPDLLILDEPFSGLDPIGRKEIRDLLLACRERGKTIFFSSHILQDMELMVDRIGIVHGGQTTREGKLADLISHSVQAIQIVFTGIPPDRIAEVAPGALERDEARELTVDDEAQLAEVLPRIMAAGGQIRSITPLKRTLEEIFLREVRA